MTRQGSATPHLSSLSRRSPRDARPSLAHHHRGAGPAGPPLRLRAPSCAERPGLRVREALGHAHARLSRLASGQLPNPPRAARDGCARLRRPCRRGGRAREAALAGARQLCAARMAAPARDGGGLPRGLRPVGAHAGGHAWHRPHGAAHGLRLPQRLHDGVHLPANGSVALRSWHQLLLLSAT